MRVLPKLSVNLETLENTNRFITALTIDDNQRLKLRLLEMQNIAEYWSWEMLHYLLTIIFCFWFLNFSSLHRLSFQFIPLGSGLMGSNK